MSQTVHVARYGALSGVEGLLVEKKSRHRLIVSITLLQRSIAVEKNRAARPKIGRLGKWQIGRRL